jgi:hypothetical protein
METKEHLISKIKEWVKIDNEMRTLQKEMTKRKNDKKTISKDLIEVMRKNEIDCFDINDGQITYCKKNVKKPITKKVLYSILSNYYEGDVEKVTEINNFILENREEVVKETVVRKIKPVGGINNGTAK